MKEENQKQPPSSTPPVLNYSTGRHEPKRSVIGEMLLGFGVWVGGEILVAGTLFYAVKISTHLAWILLSLAIIVIVSLSILSHSKWKMRGFIPGVLLGLGITCLLPLGILYAYCGNGRF